MILLTGLIMCLLPIILVTVLQIHYIPMLQCSCSWLSSPLSGLFPPISMQKISPILLNSTRGLLAPNLSTIQLEAGYGRGISSTSIPIPLLGYLQWAVKGLSGPIHTFSSALHFPFLSLFSGWCLLLNDTNTLCLKLLSDIHLILSWFIKPRCKQTFWPFPQPLLN